MPLVYQELRSLARSYLRRELAGHSLETSGLIHEAFLRLTGQERVTWQSRKHFFGIAAQSMCRILVDYARQRCYDDVVVDKSVVYLLRRMVAPTSWASAGRPRMSSRSARLLKLTTSRG